VRRLLRRRPRSGTLITLSGLDGSGKSTQAQALRDTLECLGYPTVVVWTSAPAHGALPAIAGLGRPILHLLARHRSPDEPAGPESAAAVPSERPSAGEAGARTRDPARSLRERSAILTFTWTTLMALLSGWWQSRATRIHLWRGRVVICDRYTLDSKVHMLYAYGESMRYRLQVALIRALSPRPHRAYLLDVSPEVAYARNQEYRLYQVATRARYYRDEYEALGVSRLDGERSPQEVCAEIALDVWRELR
jgi:thymidylate kinase